MCKSVRQTFFFIHYNIIIINVTQENVESGRLNPIQVCGRLYSKSMQYYCYNPLLIDKFIIREEEREKEICFCQAKLFGQDFYLRYGNTRWHNVKYVNITPFRHVASLGLMCRSSVLLLALAAWN